MRGISTWVSGSPNRALNSSTRGPRSVSISPANRQPTNGVPRRASSSTTGWWIAFDELGDVHPGDRRVGAHPAGVRPGVAVLGALVVLRRAERERARPVAEGEERDLGPFEELLDHDRLPERAAAAITPASTSLWVWQTNTPFPAASPSALITHGAFAIGRGLAAGNAGGGHHVLGEGLRSLDPGRSGSRPEHGDPGMAKLVGDPGDERRLGPDHDQVGGDRPRAAPRSPSPSSTRTGWQSPKAAIPGLPGAACSSVSEGLVEMRQASACSRAPAPTRSTFTRAESTAAGASFELLVRAAVAKPRGV